MSNTTNILKLTFVMCFIVFSACASGYGNRETALQNPTDIVWKWCQTTYSDSTRTVLSDPEKYTLQLLPDSRISIKADCNLGGGNYNLDGNQLSIKITHTTMAACPEGSHEMTYIRELNETAGFYIKKDILYIDLKNDKGTMRFSK